MERFLRYSMEHQRAIRLIFVDDEGRMRQASATVTSLNGDGSVTFVTLRPKREYTLPLSQLLGADYRKGDEGQD